MRRVPHSETQADTHARHEAEEDHVLVHLLSGPAGVGDINYNLAVRLDGRAHYVVLRLRNAGLVIGNGAVRAVYTLTPEGKARAEQVLAQRRARRAA